MAKRIKDDSNLHAEDDMKIIEEINQNINNYLDYAKDNISRGQDDKRFLYVNPWSSSQEQELNRLQKPVMSFNKTYDIIRKVIAEQRNHETQFKVSSLLGLSKEEEINIFKGAVTKIARDSETASAFDRAYDDAAVSGFGVLRAYTDYEHDLTFNQLPRVSHISDPEKCFWDTCAVEPTMLDSEFCGYYQNMSKDKFKKLHPDIKDPESFDGYFKDSTFKWTDKNTISIVEYFKKEWFTTEKYQLRNGKVMYKNEYEDMMKGMNDQFYEDKSEFEIVKKEKTQDFKIKYYKAIKGTILEKSNWLIKRLPLVRVVCDSQRINGKEHILSLVSFVKDAQMFHNLVKIEIAQALQYNRREQWMAHPSSVSGHSDMWKNPSIQQGVLLYDYDERGGIPIQLRPPEISQTLMEQARMSEMDIQSILGMYESNRGEESNELSGKAIRERQRTGLQSACVLNDNFNKAIQEMGKIIGDLLQQVVDTERTISIHMEDGTNKDKVVNKQGLDGKKELDFSKDKYDIVIDPGPSFAIQKADSLEVLMNLLGIKPDVFPWICDIIAQNIDINGSETLKKRFRELVPQEIRAKEEGLPPPPPPPPDPMQIVLEKQIEVQNREVEVKEQKNQSDAMLQEQKQILEFMIQNQKSQQEEIKSALEEMRIEQEMRAQENNKLIEEMKFYSSVTKELAKTFQNSARQHERKSHYLI